MYEFFEHTADLGLRVRTPDLDTLFAEASQAMFAVIVEDLETVQPLQKVEVHVVGTDREYLLFYWLKALLYLFDAEHLLFSRFAARVGDDGLTGTAWGEPLDRSRHNLEHEVKAITYHGLSVAKVGDEWVAEVIVDI